METIYVGTALRLFREEAGLTLAQVAEAAETHTGNLSRLERGLQDYTGKSLSSITNAVGVSLSVLFKRAEDIKRTRLAALMKDPRVQQVLKEIQP